VTTGVQVDKDIEELLGDISQRFSSYKLIIYNDSHNTMMDVVVCLMKACKCGYDRAVRIMQEAHHNGKAIALVGTKEECETAQAILQVIKLRTDIEQS
jgi:ATP-dependent Clp protease adapter protein ClpS